MLNFVEPLCLEFTSKGLFSIFKEIVESLDEGSNENDGYLSKINEAITSLRSFAQISWT